MKKIINPFSLKIEEKNIKPGCWNINNVSIFRDDQKVGEYRRTYPSFSKETFYPFFLKGQWYALISADYTGTQIFDLQKGMIIGGEESDSCGFCPTEFYIPKRYKYSEKDLSFNIYETLNEDEYYEEINSKDAIIGDEEYSPFGFVSGCHWGDDHSWKIQMIDLCEADKGVIKRTDPFNYAELPEQCSLKSCIDINDDGDDHLLFNLKVLKRHHIRL